VIHYLGGDLQFVGKVRTAGNASFLLMYPVEKTARTPARGKIKPSPIRLPDWETSALTLDFSSARRMPLLRKPNRRNVAEKLDYSDLEKLWATGQATRFAVLEVQTPGFGLYTFAREATGRKYGVRAPALMSRAKKNRWRGWLYELTTGATAISEALQVDRFLTSNYRDVQPRSIDITRVPGIRLAKHPWAKMMAGKKAVPEPLAAFVPFDNYYLHFKNPARFIEFADLLDEWGDELLRSYEINSLDYDLRIRYEKQLCFRTIFLGKILAPFVIRRIAITGSDPYLREGSDFTVLIEPTNVRLFLSSVQTFINAARREFGERLRESKSKYHNISVEHYVTPLREISLHRAIIKGCVVFSNSLVALRRVIDTFQGRYRSLAESPDFKYMRTVFPVMDKEEDGFAFLSDAFIQRLAGPATRIKGLRRLEAVTSLHMITNAALFHAWETGDLPADYQSLLAAARLKPAEVYCPEGKKLGWDATRTSAVSEVYNTLLFATPLVELSIDRITRAEEASYRRFRKAYMRGYGEYSDPIAIRFRLTSQLVQAETFIFPVIANSMYNTLQVWTGGGTTSFQPAAISPRALSQFQTHLNPSNLRGPDLRWAGQWLVVRLDDSAIYDQLVKVWIRQELEPEKAEELSQQETRLFLQVPLIVGVAVRDRKAFHKTLADWEDILQWLLGDYTSVPQKPQYRGIPITKVTFASDSKLAKLLKVNRAGMKGERIRPVFYHALIGDGWYVSGSEPCLKEQIDRFVTARKGARNGGSIPINSTLLVRPGAAVKADAALRFFLEWESHRRALTNGPIWYALFRCGLVKETMTEREKLAAAMHYLGYLPITPEHARYSYVPQRDEVDNPRHGSYRQPILHSTLDANSSVKKLLEEFRTLRADLRFRSDGIHTTLIMERRK
jgi:hypothetical protein